MDGTHSGQIWAVDRVCRLMWRDVAARHMATAVFCNLFFLDPGRLRSRNKAKKLSQDGQNAQLARHRSNHASKFETNPQNNIGKPPTWAVQIKENAKFDLILPITKTPKKMCMQARGKRRGFSPGTAACHSQSARAYTHSRRILSFSTFFSLYSRSINLV